MLFREVVRPFAAPSLAAELGLGPETTPAALATHNLLHIDDDGRPNMTWRAAVRDRRLSSLFRRRLTGPQARLDVRHRQSQMSATRAWSSVRWLSCTWRGVAPYSQHSEAAAAVAIACWAPLAMNLVTDPAT